MREYFKSDGVIDDDSRCELKTFTEKIGIEAETMELLIVSVANDYKKGTVPAVSHKKGTVPAVSPISSEKDFIVRDRLRPL